MIVMFRMFQERLYHDSSGANVNDDGGDEYFPMEGFLDCGF